jgi:hypothetical protein
VTHGPVWPEQRSPQIMEIPVQANLSRIWAAVPSALGSDKGLQLNDFGGIQCFFSNEFF